MAVSVKSPELLIPVKGIRLSTAATGMRYLQRDDLLLVEVCGDARTAAVFTTNQFCAAPVTVCRKHLEISQPKFLLVNAGIANAGLGEQGIADVYTSCTALARDSGCKVDEVLPFSTGVIGERLSVEKMTLYFRQLLDTLEEDRWLSAARAIMTTDTVCKGQSRQMVLDGHTVVVTGIAKGAGMIYPSMATMLAFVATDLGFVSGSIGNILKEAVKKSFHCITVDGDTSTNDACVFMTTGQAGVEFGQLSESARKEFLHTLHSIFLDLAQSIVRDAEGATKFISIRVDQAASEPVARNIALTIAHSPLVKTMAFACDPNWGRILAAVGRANVDTLEMSTVTLYINGLQVVTNGRLSSDYDELAGIKAMQQDEIEFRLELGMGACSARIWTTDLSYEYVKINADYRS